MGNQLLFVLLEKLGNLSQSSLLDGAILATIIVLLLLLKIKLDIPFIFWAEYGQLDGIAMPLLDLLDDCRDPFVPFLLGASTQVDGLIGDFNGELGDARLVHMHPKLHDLSELSIESLAQVDATINSIGLLPILEKRRGTIAVMIRISTLFGEIFLFISLTLFQIEHVFR